MNRKSIKKIMLFLLAFMLVFPVYSAGKAQTVQAASLKAPKLVSAVRVNKTVKFTWKKSTGASGYYVYRKVGSSSWKKLATVRGGSKTSYVDKKVVSGKTYYYTVKAYKGRKTSSYNKTGKKIVYKVPAAKPAAAKATIENTASAYIIEADVNLSGSGTGYHAKLVAVTPTSAISFGIQYDQYARAPYTGKTMFMVENVRSNNPGGQDYYWVKQGAPRKTYHLMLAVEKNGTCKCYIDGKLVKTVKNKNLANQTLYLRVEGSARKKGDSVNAVFSNIKLKAKTYSPDTVWGTYAFITNRGMKADVSSFSTLGKIAIKGTIKGISSSQDWDSAYDKVSGIIQFT